MSNTTQQLLYFTVSMSKQPRGSLFFIMDNGDQKSMTEPFFFKEMRPTKDQKVAERTSPLMYLYNVFCFVPHVFNVLCMQNLLKANLIFCRLIRV